MRSLHYQIYEPNQYAYHYNPTEYYYYYHPQEHNNDDDHHQDYDKNDIENEIENGDDDMMQVISILIIMWKECYSLHDISGTSMSYNI